MVRPEACRAKAPMRLRIDLSLGVNNYALTSDVLIGIKAPISLRASKTATKLLPRKDGLRTSPTSPWPKVFSTWSFRGRMDWSSRCVLAWRLSNTLDADFCVEALREALSRGKPEVFNTDQGGQFTGEGFTGLLEQHGVKISMDGKGRYSDNIFVERL